MFECEKLLLFLLDLSAVAMTVLWTTQLETRHDFASARDELNMEKAATSMSEARLENS